VSTGDISSFPSKIQYEIKLYLNCPCCKRRPALTAQATIQGILIGAVIAWMIVFVFLGPESDGSHFENAKVAYQDGAGVARGRDLVEHRRGMRDGEKNMTEHVEGGSRA
jgi:hypothetical protein